MSATRRASRSSRAASLSPYARPATKTSSWSLSRFLRSLNPLRLHSSKDEDRLSSDEESESDSDNEEREEQTLPSPTQSLPREEQQLTQNTSTNDQAFPSPTQSLSRTEQQLTQTISTNDQAFPSPTQSLSRREQQNVSTNVHTFPLPSSTHIRPKSLQMQGRTGLPHVEFTFKASAARNLDIVSNFLVQHAAQHANQPFRTEDINQMVALLQNSKPDEKIVSFGSCRATSPPRSKSPDLPLPRSTSAAPRPLTKNPNGSYKWKGVSSSRAFRTRNTYSSPAITIHRSTLSKGATTTLTEAEALGHDRKRRRLSDSAAEPRDSQVVNGVSSNPVPLPVASTSTDSSSRTTMMTPLQSTSAAAPVRQRTQTLQKPTAPVVPSPLRQAWTGRSPSGSESGLLQGPTPVRRTQTAQHVTDLVKSLNSQETAVAELRNPYEAANPVKRSTMPKRKRVAKKSATTTSAPKETTAKVAKEMSAHAIIEATLPKGSKRSRPSHLEKAATQDKEPLKDVTEEEIPSPKRFKPLTNGHKESEDTLCQAAKEAQQKPIAVHSKAIGTHVPIKPVNGPKSSMPKEPSKLRFSVQLESTSTPTSPTPEPNAELEASKPAVQPPKVTITAPALSQDKWVTSTTDEVPASTRVTNPIAVRTQKSAKDNARNQPLTSLPLFTFTFPFFSSGNVKVKDAAKATPIASLPTYDLACTGVAIEASKPATSFNWAAAGLKKPSASLGGGWTCGECFLSNSATATTKCTTCDAPKPGAVSKSNGIV